MEIATTQNLDSAYQYYQDIIRHIKPDIYIYTSLLRAARKTGNHRKALDIKKEMEKHNVKPDKFFEKQWLVLTAEVGDIKTTLARIKETQLTNIDCSELLKAFELTKNTTAAVSLLDVVIQQQLKLDTTTIFLFIRSFSKIGLLKEAKKLFSFLEKSTKLSKEMLTSCIIMFGKAGDIKTAETLFEKLNNDFAVDTTAFNAILQAYIDNDQFNLAFNLFKKMQTKCRPTFTTYLHLLDGLHSGQEEIGKQLHQMLEKDNLLLENIQLKVALLKMYTRCSTLNTVLSIFDRLRTQSQQHDIILLNSIISSYVDLGNAEAIHACYLQLEISKLTPDANTFKRFLNGCANLQLLELGRKIHQHLQQSPYANDITILTSLLKMYSKCNDSKSALDLFASMKELKLDQYAWNTLLSCLIQSGRYQEALALWDDPQFEKHLDEASLTMFLTTCTKLGDSAKGEQIYRHAKQNNFRVSTRVQTALLHMCSQCTNLAQTTQQFKMLRDEYSPLQTAVWNVMLEAYNKFDVPNKTFELFSEMQKENIPLDEISYIALLTACATTVSLSRTTQIHSLIPAKTLSDSPQLQTALINAYGKCAQVQTARELFDTICNQTGKNAVNIITWNAMLAAYAYRAQANQAIEFFEDLVSHKVPNASTFVNLLNACSHRGLVDQSFKYLKLMSAWNIEPTIEHYTCVVDSLARAGRLEEAENFINNLPCQPNVITWISLLGACRTFKDVQRAERVAQKAISLDPKNSSIYVLLSNTYALAGRAQDATKIRSVMDDRGVKKIPGKTWIEIAGVTHTLVAGEKDHPLINEIWNKWKTLFKELQEAGYIVDTSWALKGDSPQEQLQSLCEHSEKLAICLALILTPPGTPILIAKNLRICGDCHLASMIISKVTGRQITIRDASRFHVFEKGVCDCGGHN